MGKQGRAALVLVLGVSVSGSLSAQAEMFPGQIRSGLGRISVPELIEHYRQGLSAEEFSRLERVMALAGPGLTASVLQTLAELVHRDTWQTAEEYQRFEKLLLLRLAALGPTTLAGSQLIAYLSDTAERVRHNSDFLGRERREESAQWQSQMHAEKAAMLKRMESPWMANIPAELLLMTFSSAQGRTLAHQFLTLAFRIRDLNQENALTNFLQATGAALPSWTQGERLHLMGLAYGQAVRVLEESLATEPGNLDLLIEIAQVRLWAHTLKRRMGLDSEPSEVEIVRAYLQQGQELLDRLQKGIEERYKVLLGRSEAPFQALLFRLQKEAGRSFSQTEVEERKAGFHRNLFNSVVGKYTALMPERFEVYQKTLDRLLEQALLEQARKGV